MKNDHFLVKRSLGKEIDQLKKAKAEKRKVAEVQKKISSLWPKVQKLDAYVITVA